MARARYIVEIAEQHPALSGQYGKYVARLSTGTAGNRKYHCNGAKALEQRISELNTAGAQFSVQHFPSYIDAVRYCWDTTRYLNHGLRPDGMGFGFEYGVSFTD